MKSRLALGVIAAAWLLIAYGALVSVAGLPHVYLLLTGELKPGEPSFMGEPAPSLAEALYVLGFAVGILALGFVVKRFALKWRQSESVREAS